MCAVFHCIQYRALYAILPHTAVISSYTLTHEFALLNLTICLRINPAGPCGQRQSPGRFGALRCEISTCRPRSNWPGVCRACDRLPQRQPPTPLALVLGRTPGHCSGCIGVWRAVSSGASDSFMLRTARNPRPKPR